MPQCLNETLITLIPKCQNPESLNNFRLISLCNTIYTIVSKIIVGRIRRLLNNLISHAKLHLLKGEEVVIMSLSVKNCFIH